MRVSYDAAVPSAEVALEAVSDDDASRYWPAADTAYAEIGESVQSAQDSAKNWGAGLTAIVSALGISGLLTSGSSVNSLSTLWKVIFGLAATVSAIANAVMLYQTNFASFGSPFIKDALISSDPGDADLDPLMQTDTSVRKLKWAVRAAAVAAAAALFAAGILLFATETASAK
jgi:hypothetical protein